MATATHADVTRALESWRGSRVTVILEARESRIWLARFSGVLGGREPGGVYPIEAGGPETWVVIPEQFDWAQVDDSGVRMSHPHGTVHVQVDADR
jgi:hypothetical protein